MSGDARAQQPVLVVDCGRRACAIPLEYVLETMRPLPIEALAGTPPFVLGVALVRGEMLGVVDLAGLLGDVGRETGRFVTIRSGQQSVAIAVTGIVGISRLDVVEMSALPDLLQSVHADHVAAIAHSEGRLLLVLQASRIVADNGVDLSRTRAAST
jgi:purine-binding chemotaxis protein CheW